MNIEKGDLFNLEKSHYLVHCISADYAMGAGIAVEFRKRYNMRAKVAKIGKSIYPDCILIDNIFNLVTKKRYWDKPTMDTLRESLLIMKSIVVDNKIRNIAMPKIGCGLDKLKWVDVKKMVKAIFPDVNIEVRYLK